MPSQATRQQQSEKRSIPFALQPFRIGYLPEFLAARPESRIVGYSSLIRYVWISRNSTGTLKIGGPLIHLQRWLSDMASGC
jgi:hypothetical protein